MNLDKCVFCEHLWSPQDHVIMHIVEEHLEKVPQPIRDSILLWYLDKETLVGY